LNKIFVIDDGFLTPKSILPFWLWYEPNDFKSSCAFAFVF